MKTKTVAVIQARMGSTRLPGKVLMPMLERPLLYYIVERLKRVISIDQIVIATSEYSKDDAIEAFCRSNRLMVFRGSEEDVLDRFYTAAKFARADVVIRITADCPLIDPVLIQRLIRCFEKSKADYYSLGTGAPAAHKNNAMRYPDGLDTEIFTMHALTDAWLNATEGMHREHVTPYIWKNDTKFRIGMLMCDEGDFSNYRWTVDNVEDYRLIRWIYEELYDGNPSFGMHEVLDLLHSNPSMMQVNGHLIGKEGYEQFRN
jgi:spore coat polysaccharide biosynthesis protein SpsF